MSNDKDLEWNTPTNNDIFAETTAMPVQPDIFKETDAMPLDMEKERARKESVSKEESPDPVEVDSNEVEDIDLGIVNVAEAEKEYREATGENKGQPEAITNTVVREVIRTVPSDKTSKPDSKSSKAADKDTKTTGVSDADQLKRVVETVLDEETANKLSKYEKRRKRRERKKRLSFILKLVVVLAIAVILYRNDATRERIAILATDTVDFVQRIINKDEDSSSNKLVNDALNSLGTKLNEINTHKSNKYIYLDENGSQISEEEYLKNNKAVKVDLQDTEQAESEK